MSARRADVDVARGLGVLFMVARHAVDGWSNPETRNSAFFALTRELGGIPAPLFACLVGYSFVLARRGKISAEGTVSGIQRGLGLLALGYGVSAVYLAIEGTLSVPTLLRADILHMLGLSLVVLNLLARFLPAIFRPTVLVVLAVGCCLVSVVLSPVKTSNLWLNGGLGLFIDVPPLSRFPMLPMLGFPLVGAAVAQVDWPSPNQRPASKLRGLALAFGLVIASRYATSALVEVVGGALSRAHPALLANFAEGAFKAYCVLVVAGWFVARSAAVLCWLGRRSLFIYAVHLPFCYGAWAWSHQTLDVRHCVLLVPLLVFQSALLSAAKDWLAAGVRAKEVVR